MSSTSQQSSENGPNGTTLAFRVLLSVAVVVSIALMGFGGVAAAAEAGDADEPAATSVDEVACAWAPSGIGSYYVACVTVDADQDGAEACVEDHRQLSDYERPSDPQNEYCVEA